MVTRLGETVEQLLGAYGILDLGEPNASSNTSISYVVDKGMVRFFIDAAGENISMGNVDEGTGIPAEIAQYVSGAVSMETQRELLTRLLGPQRIYPNTFRRTLWFLSKTADVSDIVRRFGNLGLAEALDRLENYRRTNGLAW